MKNVLQQKQIDAGVVDDVRAMLKKLKTLQG